MTELTIQSPAHWHWRGDANTVEGRMVPFGEPAMVVEDGEVYTEMFDPGSMTRMEQIAKARGNAAWIAFNLEHDEGFPARIGYARTLEQRDDGAWGIFKLYPGNDLAKVRSMLEESHTGLSVMFDDIAPPREVDGIRHRVQVSVRHVAATPMPTYAGATITAVRATEPPLVVGTPALDEWTAWLDAAQR